MSVATALVLNDISKSFRKLAGKSTKIDNEFIKADFFEFNADKWIGIGNKDQKIILQHSLGVKPDMVAILPNHYDWDATNYPEHDALVFHNYFAACTRYFGENNALMYTLFSVDRGRYEQSCIIGEDNLDYCVSDADENNITFTVSKGSDYFDSFVVPPKQYIGYKIVAIKYLR